ncbi:GNAT family N-acetyltransferase [Salinimonas chungwhensis]|uniref:GNAT family N-acetyltransferase n=1 Tax=Salinimonas chungwhensis TaxID=265425 RepID=UPI00037E3278|nr:GNAT family N-acetyltransferase [Salinimonas chungwhensis]
MGEMTLFCGRLKLRLADQHDVRWVYELNNDPLWVRYIGNRSVHSIADARRYIDNALSHFERWGYGLWVIERRDTGKAQGMCGLINRGIFSSPDLGFALLKDARGKGYAQEASAAVLDWAARHHRFPYITAMAHPDNNSSQKLLGRLGFNRQGMIFMPNVARQILFRRD